MTDALRVMAIGGLMRQAIKLVRGCNISQTEDEFIMDITSVIGWFKVRRGWCREGGLLVGWPGWVAWLGLVRVFAAATGAVGNSKALRPTLTRPYPPPPKHMHTQVREKFKLNGEVCTNKRRDWRGGEC